MIFDWSRECKNEESCCEIFTFLLRVASMVFISISEERKLQSLENEMMAKSWNWFRINNDCLWRSAIKRKYLMKEPWIFWLLMKMFELVTQSLLISHFISARMLCYGSHFLLLILWIFSIWTLNATNLDPKKYKLCKLILTFNHKVGF